MAFLPLQLVGLILSIIGRSKSIKGGYRGTLGLVGIILNLVLMIIVIITSVVLIVLLTTKESGVIEKQTESTSENSTPSRSQIDTDTDSPRQSESSDDESSSGLGQQLETDSAGLTGINHLGSITNVLLQKDTLRVVLISDGRDDVVVSAVRLEDNSGDEWVEEWDMTDSAHLTRTYVISFISDGRGGTGFTVSSK